MCKNYFIIIRPIWNKLNDITTYQEFNERIINVSPGLFRSEATMLNYQGDGDFKKRGKFGLILIHLACQAINILEDSIEIDFWLNILENLVKSLLFIAESNKKTLVRQESKLYSTSISYAIGFLSVALIKHESKLLLQNTLAKIIKYTFTTFSINSTKNQMSGLKSIIKLNLSQYNYPCDYIVAFILQYNSGIEA